MRTATTTPRDKEFSRVVTVAELLFRRDCRIPGCANELEKDDPTSGRYANMCGPCRRGETVPSRLYFASLPHGRRFDGESPSSDGKGEALTPREEEILFALADGLANREIADELGIHVETVNTHIKRLLPKMRARNRTHAVALAYHHGLLKPLVA